MRVRELRESRGLQQKDLAIDLCVSQPTISDCKSGRKVPSAKSTQKLADYFGVTIQYFTAGAKKLADANGILLWDRDKLEEMLRPT